jgi:hypothetical protein
MFEVLEGINRRCEELGMELPSMLVADNCCQIEKEAHKAMPDIQICLDVYHFMMRYILSFIRAPILMLFVPDILQQSSMA